MNRLKGFRHFMSLFIRYASYIGIIAVHLSLLIDSSTAAPPQSTILQAEGKRMNQPKNDAKKAIIDHVVRTIDGEEVKLSDYRGKALLIVNTASYCGYTKQYADLKALQDKYSGQNFTVLAFPCNDFGGQEPGSAEEIKRFCKSRFEINFPLFEKVKAKGDKSPLYKTLTEESKVGIRGEIKWNFTKFLVDAKGEVVDRFESGVNPNSPPVHKAIEAAMRTVK